MVSTRSSTERRLRQEGQDVNILKRPERLGQNEPHIIGSKSKKRKIVTNKKADKPAKRAKADSKNLPQRATEHGLRQTQRPNDYKDTLIGETMDNIGSKLSGVADSASSVVAELVGGSQSMEEMQVTSTAHAASPPANTFQSRKNPVEVGSSKSADLKSKTSGQSSGHNQGSYELQSPALHSTSESQVAVPESTHAIEPVAVDINDDLTGTTKDTLGADPAPLLIDLANKTGQFVSEAAVQVQESVVDFVGTVHDSRFGKDAKNEIPKAVDAVSRLSNTAQSPDISTPDAQATNELTRPKSPRTSPSEGTQ